MKAPLACLLLLLPVSVPLLADDAPGTGREERLINDAWDFHLGKLDSPDAPGAGWETVDVPHDWAIRGPFDPEADGSQGKLPWKGEGWYRKDLTLSAADLAGGRRVLLLFDGVMANPVVSVNGQPAGSWRYGYNSFWLDVTELVHADAPNRLVVHASTEEHYSRWYPGAGIFRKVRLILTDPVHIPVWGVCVTTPEITDASAKVHVATEVANDTGSPQEVTVVTRLLDPAGKTVAETEAPVTVPAGEFAVRNVTLDLASPQRWDVDHPNLYTAVSEIRRGGRTVDTLDTRFGVRTFEWTANDGLHLNGRRVQIRGVCLHHDNGPLGAALFRDSLVRKLTIMKDMGVNSIRTSHNVPSPEMLELCDEMGLIVIDEIFDKYGATASVDTTTADFVDHYAEPEVRNFVRRDRNHPSVLLWSVGNEIPDILANRDGKARDHVAKMAAYFRKYDPTRPNTMACHITGAVDRDVLAPLDTTGWNYGQKYLQARRKYPEKPVIYTESASAFSTRGYYQFPHPRNRNAFSRHQTESSYDLTSATWSDIPDVEFMRMERDRYVAGEYVWTGFDYLGEPTPHTKEARSSYFGIVDLVGIPKDRYYLYRSYWNHRDPTVHLLPHWNWPERTGKPVPVYVYTNGDEAELFLNGRSLGRRKRMAVASSSNLAHGKPAKASTEEIRQDEGGNVLVENRADKAFDGALESRWCASSGDTPQWLQVDLGEVEPIRHVAIHWEKAATLYTFQLETSDDGSTWTSIGSSASDQENGTKSVFAPDIKARYLRIRITAVGESTWASINEVQVESQPPAAEETVQDPYYRIMDRYRLRWEEVRYEPGTLGVIAYKNGKEIGRKVVITAGKPARLRLTPEKETLTASGDTLAYVLVEAIDAHGNFCPRDMSMVDFSIAGPATIAGIGNGDPLSLDPFQDARHPLFFGKAMLIVRSKKGQTGEIEILAKAKGLRAGGAKLSAVEP